MGQALDLEAAYVAFRQGALFRNMYRLSHWSTNADVLDESRIIVSTRQLNSHSLISAAVRRALERGKLIEIFNESTLQCPSSTLSIDNDHVKNLPFLAFFGVYVTVYSHQNYGRKCQEA